MDTAPESPAPGVATPSPFANGAAGATPLPSAEAAEVSFTPEPLSLDESPSEIAEAGPVPADAEESPSHAFRWLLRAAVTFAILFMTLRTIAFEPFGVPTGSMAPTLIGNHREGPCPRCGHPVRIGDPGPGERADTFDDAHCPNCGQVKIDLSAARDISGDRLMVDKNIFSLRQPRRWEVAVFRCPVDDSKPYVKRVVGLPGEVITIVDGDVYANGELLRKGLAEVRETRLPFFDMAYPLKSRGWADRWLVEPVTSDPRLPVVTPVPTRTDPPLPTPTPADAAVLRDNALHLDAAASPEKTVALSYRHTKVDDDNREAEVRAWNSYNGPPRRSNRTQSVHDFAVSCDLEIVGGAGTVECRLFDGVDSATLELKVGPKADGLATLTRERHGALASVQGVGLEVGRTYHLDYAFFDRRVTTALDGKEILPAADMPPLKNRGDVKRPFQLGVRGCHVVVRQLKLYHDIHYTHGSQNDVAAWPLKPDEYFLLGDNTTNSHDSREWRDAEKNPATGKYDPRPGVPEAYFLGKPFLIHQPLRLGRTTLGGQERVFQTLDWSRLRWLH